MDFARVLISPPRAAGLHLDTLHACRYSLCMRNAVRMYSYYAYWYAFPGTGRVEEPMR